MEKIQEIHNSKLQHQDEKLKLIIKQHLELVASVKALGQVQGDIAKQLVKQHEDTEALYTALGLKQDISHYSFNMMDAEEH